MGKLPPQVPELEESVLGALMIEQNAYAVVADLLRPSSFYKDQHRYIYEAIQSLASQEKPIDILTVAESLKRLGKLEAVGGVTFLSDLTRKVASTAHLYFHAQIIAQKATARDLIAMAAHIEGQAYDETQDVEDLMQEAESTIFQISQQNQKRDVTQIDPVISEAFERMRKAAKNEGNISGIPSGFHELDKITSGWQKSDLIIIAARPAMGKTNIALNFARNVTMLKGKTAVLFSLEMSKEEIAERLLAMDSGIENGKFRSGELNKEDWTALGESIGRYSMTNLYIDDTSNLTVPSLKSRVRRVPHADIVFIDYLGLLTSSAKKENRVQEISSITRELKIMAKELGIPVVVCAQLNRGSAEGRARKPVLTDLRESGSIEQDADVVLFLHRDYYYTEPGSEPSEDAQDVDPTAAELIIAKNRHGGLDSIKLHFDGEHSKFTAIQYIKDSDFA